jgi:signal transduction histidine kinase
MHERATGGLCDDAVVSSATFSTGPSGARPPLVRRRECVLGGACEAVARHLGWQVTSVRWLCVAIALCGGAGVLLYLWLWALTPLEPASDASDARVHRVVPVAWMLVAGAAVAAILVLVVIGAGPNNAPVLFGAAGSMIALAVGAVAWEQFVDVTGAARPRGASAVRITAGALLLAMVFITPAIGGVRNGFELILLVITLVAGLVVLLGPWGIRLWQELIAERTKRVREEQRAEIAAHLHDSVLQTLALIQNRAGASSEVARIARAQERELREWLYAGAGTLDSDLGTDLRDFAAALELDYPVRIEVITVGDALERASSEIAAAAREAMLNAARHAGGEISVYVESSESALDVFVRDRGPGFVIARVPEDRLGVRESIIGRMRRAGGWATVSRGVAGVGTEVHLHQEHAHAPSENVPSENASSENVSSENSEGEDS